MDVNEIPYGTKFSLKISDFTPETIPMSRLAEYMSAMATLMGSEASVHFMKIGGGSAVLQSFVEPRDEPKTSKRLELVKLGGGPQDARSAFDKIDKMLVEDATDAIFLHEKSKVIIFPGKNRPKGEMYKRVTQEDSVDGVLILIGGRDETVPVHLQDGRTVYKCNTSRSKARELAPHLFGSPLRAYGPADWRREEDGSWHLNNLVIANFVPISSGPAVDVIEKLRAIPGNHWHLEEEPYALLSELRNGIGDNE